MAGRETREEDEDENEEDEFPPVAGPFAGGTARVPMVTGNVTLARCKGTLCFRPYLRHFRSQFRHLRHSVTCLRSSAQTDRPFTVLTVRHLRSPDISVVRNGLTVFFTYYYYSFLLTPTLSGYPHY
jgi:hypothetical protein